MEKLGNEETRKVVGGASPSGGNLKVCFKCGNGHTWEKNVKDEAEANGVKKCTKYKEHPIKDDTAREVLQWFFGITKIIDKIATAGSCESNDITWEIIN